MVYLTYFLLQNQNNVLLAESNNTLKPTSKTSPILKQFQTQLNKKKLVFVFEFCLENLNFCKEVAGKNVILFVGMDISKSGKRLHEHWLASSLPQKYQSKDTNSTFHD